MKGPYDDMMGLPHHISPTRPQMSEIARAAQFAPFAALTGHDAAIRETGRLTDRRRELSEEEKAILDRKQALLMERIGTRPEITVTYFIPDSRKDGGAYVTVSGRLRKIDEFGRTLWLNGGHRILLDDIFDIQSIDGVSIEFKKIDYSVRI